MERETVEMMQKTYDIQSGYVSKNKGNNTRTLTMTLSEVQTIPGMIGMIQMPVSLDNPSDEDKAAVEDLDNYQVQVTYAFVKIQPATPTAAPASK